MRWYILGLLFLVGCSDAPQMKPNVEAKFAEAESPVAEPAHSIASPESPTFTVATWNMMFANQEWDAAIRVLRDADADVICLQETSPAMEAHLAEQLSESHPHRFFSGGGGAYAADRFGFFSRHPIDNTTRVPRSAGLFDAWVVEVSPPGETIQVASVHLRPAVLHGELGPVEAMQALQSVDEAHGAELKALLAVLNPALPTLVVGDFNSLAAASGLRPLAEQRLHDCLAEVLESPETHTTWEWPTPWGKGGMRIDHLFRCGRLKTESVSVLPGIGSDHRLVTGRFRVVEP